MRKRIFSIAVLALVASLARLSAADDKKPAPEPSAQEKAMMEAWMKYSTPGEPHKMLASLEGSWTAKVKEWMAPDAPATESEATAEMKMVLGGRFLQQTFQGSMMGQPYTGMGYTGYDNYKKQFSESWMDSTSTATILMMGTMDHAAKSMTATGEMDDFMTGKKSQMKSVWTMLDADHNTFELWAQGPDGKMGKLMEIAYSRRK